MPAQLNRFTHRRAQLVLHGRGGINKLVTNKPMTNKLMMVQQNSLTPLRVLLVFTERVICPSVICFY
jgi:hypothetical protein